MIELPKFQVIHDGYSTYVQWHDEEKRYHFWLTADGKPSQNVLHSNLRIKPTAHGSSGYRPLRLDAKKWAPIVEGILAAIKAGDMIQKAIRERFITLKCEQEARQQSINDARLRKFRVACCNLSGALQEAMNSLPDDEKIDFVLIMECET